MIRFFIFLALCLAVICLFFYGIAKAAQKPNDYCDYVPRRSDEVQVFCQGFKDKIIVNVRICGIEYYTETYCR